MDKVKQPASKDASPYFKNLSLKYKKPLSVNILLNSARLSPGKTFGRKCQSSLLPIS
jgi:hypothetical protein